MSDFHVDPAEGFSIQEMYQLLHLLKKLQHCLGYVPAPFFRYAEDGTRDYLEFATGGPDSQEKRVSVHEMQDFMLNLKERGANMPPNNIAPFLRDELEAGEEF